MSFLEERDTLEDVLAFIDSYDEDSVGSVSPSSSSSKREGKPKRANAVDNRRARSQSYRIRQEIHRLRADAKQLEAKVAELSKPSDVSYEEQLIMLKELNSSAHQAKKCIEAVLREYRRRQESERTNQQLKVLLAKQMRTIRASESAFGTFSETEISLVFQSQRVMQAQNSAMDDIQIMASLGDRLMKLELNVESVVNRTSVGSMNSSLRNDSNWGILFESSSCTPMPCSVEHVDKLLTWIYSYKMAKHKGTALNQDSVDVKITKRKQFHHEQEKHDLVVKTRMRRIDQPRHVAYMQSSITTLPGGHVSFIEENTFIIARPPQSLEYDSNQASESGSLLVNWHRVQAQHYDVPSTLARDRALDTLKHKFISDASNKDELHFQKLTKWLCKNDGDTELMLKAHVKQ